MYRILICEDNGHAAKLKDFLEQFVSKVELVDNLSDATEFLEDNPGADKFDMLFLDLSMSSRDLPDELQQYGEQYIEKYFAGWLFYKHFLVKYPKLQEKTVFYTAFQSQFREQIGDNVYEKLNILSKSNPNMLENAKEYVAKFLK